MITTTPTLDFGAVKRLRILCVPETGWFDTASVFHAIPWPPFGSLHADDAAGFSTLLEPEALEGSMRRMVAARRRSEVLPCA